MAKIKDEILVNGFIIYSLKIDLKIVIILKKALPTKDKLLISD